MKLRAFVKKILLKLLSPFGLAIVQKKSLIDFYLHEYNSYEEYRDIQIFHNKRKIKSIFADEKTIKRVYKILEKEFKKEKTINGICHGTRNGFEQNYLRSLSKKFDVFGTDISETARDFENSIQWDFHKTKKSWLGYFHFVYSNSLDQSYKPKKALQSWLSQLKLGGLLILEHTNDHGPNSANEMDPFGVKPTTMPYVLTMWFGSQISIEHSLESKSNTDLDAWLFVIRKNVDNVKIIDKK